MSFTFHRCQTHPDIKDLIGWYLELQPDDLTTLEAIWPNICNSLFMRFNFDPHLKDNPMYKPVKLAAGWRQTVEKYLLQGMTLGINCAGGFAPLSGFIILSTLESETLDWPDYFPDERITIAKWPDGKHWYVISSKNRVFAQSKFIGYEDARNYALKFTNSVRSR